MCIRDSRYYALVAWYRRAYPEGVNICVDVNDLTPCEQKQQHAAARHLFREKLRKRFRTTLHQLVGTHTPDRVLLCVDGRNNWRKQCDADYKRNRKHSPFVHAMFQECLQTMHSMLENAELPKHSVVLNHPELEADDIVHYFVRTRVSASSEDRMTIVANDHDYIPLLSHDSHRIQIADVNGKSVCCPSAIPLDKFLEVKILSGDKSDNIPPVFPRCGVKTALRLAEDPDKLKQRLHEDTMYKSVSYTHLTLPTKA